MTNRIEGAVQRQSTEEQRVAASWRNDTAGNVQYSPDQIGPLGGTQIWKIGDTHSPIGLLVIGVFNGFAYLDGWPALNRRIGVTLMTSGLPEKSGVKETRVSSVIK